MLAHILVPSSYLPDGAGIESAAIFMLCAAIRFNFETANCSWSLRGFMVNLSANSDPKENYGY